MIRVGARGSQLSRIQTSHFVDELGRLDVPTEVMYSISPGDRNQVTPIHQMGQDGVFTSHLERLLVEGRIDIAVHSMKDLPTRTDPRLLTIPVLPREDPRDILLIQSSCLEEGGSIPELSPETTIATSSVRRRSQLGHLFPNVVTVDVRGNIDTRVRKLSEGWFDGLVISSAALKRFPQELPEEVETVPLPIELFPTSPGQGQLAVQVRREDQELQCLIEQVRSPDAECVSLERKIFSSVGYGCISPVGITILPTPRGHSLHFFDGRIPGTVSTVSIDGELANLERRLLSLVRSTADGQSIPAKVPNIIVTKSEDHPLSKELMRLGLRVYCAPVVTSIPLTVKENLNLEGADWVLFTSPRGAKYLPDGVRELLRKKKIAVIGSVTAHAVQQRQLPVHFVSKESNSSGLISSLKTLDPGLSTVVHIGAEQESPNLSSVFHEHDVVPRRIGVYTTFYSVPDFLPQLIPTEMGDSKEWCIISTSTKITALLSSLPFPEDVNWIVYSERSRAVLKRSGVHDEHVHVCRPGDVKNIMEVLSR